MSKTYEQLEPVISALDERLDDTNAETTDIRVGADGTTYASAGAAVRGQIGSLKADLNKAFANGVNYELISWQDNMYYITSGDTIDVTSPSSNNQWRSAVVPCSAGDRFRINAKGESSIRAYTFIDVSGNILLRSSSGTINKEVIAPSSAAKIVLNDRKTDKLNYKGYTVGETIENMAGVYTHETPEIIFTYYAYAKSFVDTFDPTDIVANNNWKYAIVECSENDVFVINGTGQSPSLLWAFFGSEYQKIKLAESQTGDYTRIIAPKGSAYLVINVNIATEDPKSYYGGVAKMSDIIQMTSDIAKLKRITDTLPPIPEYYDGYLADKITAINSMEDESGLTGDTFIFVTDYHRQSNTKHSAGLIRKIMDNTGAHFVVFGGDTQDYETTFDAALAQIVGFYTDYASVHNDMFSIIGNHEFNSHYHDVDPTHYDTSIMLTKNQVYNLLCKRKEFKYNEIDTNGNWRIDSTAQKIRYYFVGCTADCKIPNESLAWIMADFNTVPSGYGIVVFSHLSYETSSTYTGKIFTDNYVRQIGLAMDALNSRGTYMYNSVEYDYSNSQAEAICIIGGHTHFDADKSMTDILIGVVPNVQIIAVTTDAYEKQKPTTGAVTRTAGTTTEQAFDVVHIDRTNRKIIMKRIGGGADREFNY